MSDLAINDRAVERRDTMRDTLNDLYEAGLRDENLRDAIIDELAESGAVHWQEDPHVWVGPLNIHGGLAPEHLERIITVAITATARRIAEDIEDEGRDLDIVGGRGDAARTAYQGAAAVARTLAALYSGDAS